LPCSAIDASTAGAPVFQFAQVAEALFEVAQLGVVEAAGDFLAVAGDEGHGGAFVEQLHGSDDLRRLDADLGGDSLFYGGEHGKHERFGGRTLTAFGPNFKGLVQGRLPGF
jgi:hypothetical protein